MPDEELKIVFDGDSAPLESAARRASTAIRSIQPASAAAGGALISLTRVIQDAPFGFIAIQNNITELPNAFARLSASAGGTRAAFLALGGSLLGPAGIGFAVSTLTSLATVAVQRYGSLSASLTKVSEEAKKAKQEQDSVISGVGQEAARVSVLVTALESATLSHNQRNAAIKELGRLAPEYFGNLKNEQGLVGDVTQAYAIYQQNLVKIAESRAFEKKLEGLFTKRIELELSVDPDRPGNVVEISKSVAQTTKDAFIKQFNAGGNVGQALVADVQKNTDVFTKQGQFIGKTISAGAIKATTFFDGKKVNQQFGDLDNQIDFFLKKISALGQTNLADVLDPKERVAREKRPQRSLEQIFEAVQEQTGKSWVRLIAESDKQVDDYFTAMARQVKQNDRIQRVRDALLGTTEAIRKGIVAAPTTADIGADIPFNQDTFGADRLEKTLAKYRSLNLKPPDLSFLTDAGAKADLLQSKLGKILPTSTAVAKAVAQTLSPAFNELFTNLFSKSQTAIQAFTGFFKQLLVQIASTIASAAALAGILSLFSGGGAAVGASSNGFGSIFKSLLGIGKGAGLGYSGFGNAFQVELRARGSDLVGVLNTANNSNRRRGG